MIKKFKQLKGQCHDHFDRLLFHKFNLNLVGVTEHILFFQIQNGNGDSADALFVNLTCLRVFAELIIGCTCVCICTVQYAIQYTMYHVCEVPNVNISANLENQR